MDFIEECSKYFHQQGEYSELQITSASLSLLQAAIGANWISKTKDGRRLNAYYIGIGEAGSNKTILTKQLETLAHELGLSFPNVATPEALTQFVGGKNNKAGETVIDPHYEGYIIYDEISRLFRSSAHMENIFITLSQLWSSQRYSYMTANRGFEGFEAGTAISMFGLGTEEVLKHLKEYHFTQGFGRRPFWYTIEPQHNEYVSDDFFSAKRSYTMPNNLMNMLRQLRDVSFTTEDIMLDWSADAMKRYIVILNKLKKFGRRYRNTENHLKAIYMNSAPEMLSLLAGTKAISRQYIDTDDEGAYINKIIKSDDEGNVLSTFGIEIEDVEWSYQLYKKYLDGFDNIMSLWKRSQAKDKEIINIEPMVNKVIAHIENVMSTNHSFSMKKVEKECQMPPKDFNETMEVLVSRGIVKVKEGRRSTYYYVPVSERGDEAEIDELLDKFNGGE